MNITFNKLRTVFPSIKEDTVQYLTETMERYEIDSPLEICSFLAQVGHESGGFVFKIENLNYSADGLLKTFGKYFTKSTAAQYSRKPREIANVVYANRMGNGDIESGDGYRFRGRGYIQITGRNNYQLFAFDNEMDVDEATAYLETEEGCCESAAWYWWNNSLHRYVNDFATLTKRINGGTNGLQDRTNLLNRLKATFNVQ